MRNAIICLVVAAAAGCHLLPPAPPPMEVYDLGPATGGPEGAFPPVEIRVTAAAELRTRDMLYRNAANPGRLLSYAEHRWAAPPALMLERQLLLLTAPRAAIGGSAMRVEINLLAFEQYFEGDHATAVLTAVATLTKPPRECARTRFDIHAPMAHGDAPSGARAFTTATAELAERLAEWVGTTKECAEPSAH